MITKLAVKWLTRRLRKDKELWYAYQSNIAMAIYDNMNKYLPLRTGKGIFIIHATKEELNGALARGYCHKITEKEVLYPDLIIAMTEELLKISRNQLDASPDPSNKEFLPTQHEFCNLCANDFLNLWTKKEIKK